MSDAPAQLPPADELAAIRAELKALEEREAQLRQIMISDPTARRGNEYIVEVLEAHTTYTDIKELRAMHSELVKEYTFPKTITRVVLFRVTDDGEIVSIRHHEHNPRTIQ